MPDTLPWEDFATAPAEHGPWEDFAQGGIINNNATDYTSKLRDQVAKDPNVGGYGQEAKALGDVLNFAPIGSANPPEGVVPAAANWIGQQITPGNLLALTGAGTLLKSEAVTPIIKRLIGGIIAAQGFRGLHQVLGNNPPTQQTQEFMSGPGMPGTFVGLPGAEGAVQALMHPTVSEDEADQQRVTKPVGTPGQQTSEFLDYIANLGMVGGGAATGLKSYPSQPITPEVLPAEPPSQRPAIGGEVIDVESRPWEDFKQLTDVPVEMKKPDIKFMSGVNPEDLRPAVEVAGRLLVGQKGDTHADVLERNGFDPREVPHTDPRRMFTTADGKQKFDRQAAAKIIGKGTAEAGGADSMDLPGAAAAKLMSKMEAQDNAAARTRAGRGETQYFSGVPVPELEKVWDTMKKWYASPVADTKDWSPLRNPEVMKKEILESKTATPITSKVAGITLPTEGATTTLADRLIDTKNALGKKIASVQDLVNKGDKMYSPMDVVFDMADGGKARFDGPLFRNIRWPLDFDFNAELNLRKQKMDPVRELVKKYDLKEKNGLRLGIYAMVQQGATERLVKNGVPQTYIDNIVKTLSPQEKEVYTLARRQLDSLFPSVQQVAKDVLGLDVQPVKDYFPMHRDWRDIPKTPDELAKPRSGDLMSDAVDFLQADFTKRGTKTERGYTVERVPDAKTAVKLNFFDVYERHVKDVAHFVASQKRLNEIAKIVRDPVFAEKYGDVTQKLTMDWLNAYAKQGRNINALPQLDWMRKAIARGVLGFRVASQFVHLANVPLGMQRAGLENYTKGLAAALSEQGQAFLRKNLAETFERGGGELELIEKQGKVEKAAFAPQRALDRWNSQATSLGIYLREGGTLDGPVNEKALAQARVEARRAVASPLYKDLPPLLRTQSGKIFAQFQNTFMDQWSNIRYDLPVYLRDNPKKAMGLLVALAAMTMVESGIKHGAKKGLQAATGYEPKHGDENTYWKKVGHEALRRIPGYGQLSSMWEYGSSGVPLLDVVKEEGKAVKEAVTSDDTTGRQLAGVKAVTGAAELAGVTGAGQLSEVVQNAIKAKGYKPHSKRIQEIADKAGLDLSDFKQRLAGEAVMKENREPMTEAEKLRSAQAAMKNMSERRQAVMNGLNKEDKQWLKSNKIEPPGFGDYVEEGKVRVPYTDAENRFATETYKSEYETVISYLRNDPGFKQMNRNEQQVRANEEFRTAARRARETVVEVVKSGALVEKSKKKRFSAFAPE